MLAHAILASARQAWPPFVLVAGLLLIGVVAADDGLFEALGARLARTSLGPRRLLLALLALVAVVTAVLNLGAAATIAAAVLVVTLSDAAIPVFALGLVVTAARRLRPQIDRRALALLFTLTVLLGTVAQFWHGPADLLDGRGAWVTAGIGAT